MVCPKCQANVASDSNFCPRCGAPFRKPRGFVANLWRDNKPGFLILSLLLIAMLGSIGYYLNSRTGKFLVTVQRVSADDAIDFYTKAALEVYCREFGAECQQGKTKAIGTEIKRVIPTLFRDNAGGYARISYYNGTGAPITATRFKYRQPPGPWREGNSRNYYQPKIDQLRAILLKGGKLPFEHKVDLAFTIATVEHSVPFTLQSGESKTCNTGCRHNQNQCKNYSIRHCKKG